MSIRWTISGNLTVVSDVRVYRGHIDEPTVVSDVWRIYWIDKQ